MGKRKYRLQSGGMRFFRKDSWITRRQRIGNISSEICSTRDQQLIVETVERRALHRFGRIIKIGERKLKLIIKARPDAGIERGKPLEWSTILRSLQVEGGRQTPRPA